MTKRRETDRRTRLEKNREAVILALAERRSLRDIAAQFNSHPVSVWHFHKRHLEEIEARQVVVAKALADFDLAEKVNRVAGYQEDYDLLGDVIKARQQDKRYDEPGYATGFMAHTLKAIGGGENMTVVDEFKVDTSLVAQRNAIRHAVAEETGQLPRPNDGNLQVNVFAGFELTWHDGTPA
jgi:hypothetical protein